MPRDVQLQNGDGSVIYGKATLPSDFPAQPKTLTWKGKVFNAEFEFGAGLEPYVEDQHAIHLADDAVTSI